MAGSPEELAGPESDPAGAGSRRAGRRVRAAARESASDARPPRAPRRRASPAGPAPGAAAGGGEGVRAARAPAVAVPSRPRTRRKAAAPVAPPAAPVYTRPEPIPAEAGATALYDLVWRSGILNVLTVARRELAVYLVSPIGYVAATVLILPVSLFAYLSPLTSRTSVNMSDVYALVIYLTVFFAPLNTMRLLAEERRSGTLEVLLTSPVRDWEVVTGKWLGAFVYFVLSTAFVVVYVLLLAHYSQSQTVVTILGRDFEIANLEYGAILTGYVGMVLVGGAFLAVGILASSLTHNQVIAAVIGIGVLVFLVYALGFLSGLLIEPYADLLDYVSTYNRYQAFLQGQVALRDVVYFVSLTAAALFLTVRILESRKWR